MSGPEIEGFLDLAYGAAVDHALWPRVLEAFAELVGGHGAALVWQNQTTRQGEGLVARLDPAVLDQYFTGFATRHPSQRWMNDPRQRLRHFVPHIALDDDAMAKSDLVRTAFYNDFMRPFDLHSVARLGLAARGYDAAFLMVSRPEQADRFGDEQLSLATRLHPHLIRAFELGQKTPDAGGPGPAAAEAFDRSPNAFFVLGEDGRLRYANPAGEALLAAGAGLSVIAGRLAAPVADETARLMAMVGAAASANSDNRRGGAMALTRPDHRLPLAVSVIPVRTEGLSLLVGGPCVLVCVTDLEAGVSLPEQRLRDLLGLSRAEARVALALFQGDTPREAAERLGVSFFTVRGHLVRIFEKTGAGRQSELIRLLSRAASEWPG